MIRYSAKDVKDPVQPGSAEGHALVGHGVWQLMSSTDLFVRHPLFTEGELECERSRRLHESFTSSQRQLQPAMATTSTTSSPLSSKTKKKKSARILAQQQQRTNPPLLRVNKLLRCRRDELKKVLANAYISGGVEKAMKKARQGLYYEFTEGVKIWGDFIQVWDKWITSIRQDAFSALPHITQRSKLDANIRRAVIKCSDPVALEKGGHRRGVEKWLDADVPLLMSEATLARCLVVVDFAHVEQVLGYQFRERRYLVGILNAGTGTISRAMFERLEWLGDAIIELLASEYWYNRPPTTSATSTMSSMKTLTVCNHFLGLLTIFLGCYRYVSGGEDEKWEAMRDALSRLLDLKDVDPSERQRYAALPPLEGRLGRMPFEDLVHYLRRRADVERVHSDWAPFWIAVPMPKKGGDFFEALFGAVYQDAGFNYAVVSQVFRNTMQVVLDIFLSPGQKIDPIDTFSSSMNHLGCSKWVITSIAPKARPYQQDFTQQEARARSPEQVDVEMLDIEQPEVLHASRTIGTDDLFSVSSCGQMSTSSTLREGLSASEVSSWLNLMGSRSSRSYLTPQAMPGSNDPSIPEPNSSTSVGASNNNNNSSSRKSSRGSSVARHEYNLRSLKRLGKSPAGAQVKKAVMKNATKKVALKQAALAKAGLQKVALELAASNKAALRLAAVKKALGKDSAKCGDPLEKMQETVVDGYEYAFEVQVHGHVVAEATGRRQVDAWNAVIQQALNILDEHPHYVMMHCTCALTSSAAK
ncbi:Endoribonuclease Dicer [Actinomortierella ambigua]|nr:Endoribonuclease Dicer [Actinomortierella ambigua]